MKIKAFVTGINGQDGSYLAEHLLSLGHTVHGLIRRSSTINTKNIDHLMQNPEIFNKTLFIYYGDVTDPLNIMKLINDIKPDKIFNLAAQSHVKISFDIPYYTSNVDAIGILNILEACRILNPTCKIYQASTSELFGGQLAEMPKNGFTEQTPFHPRSPYGVAKLYGYWIVKNYRESYNMFCCSGILFNHSSPRRGENFLTRKVTRWVSENIYKIQNKDKLLPLELGNLDAFRDEGHSYDFVRAMNLILEQQTPQDYVAATGETHSVREWVENCFKYYNLNIEWQGEGVNEIGICNDQIVVVINPKYFRPAEVDYLLGDPTKAKTELSWTPTFSYYDLVADMMKTDQIDIICKAPMNITPEYSTITPSVDGVKI